VSAQTFDGGPYDLVTSFDCLHDMGDPLGAARHIREMLAPDGTWMVVEPYAAPYRELATAGCAAGRSAR
jgi:2-polyprenyl-3-methyl-5-hydroxy-6-metoxy-1,4-benzoquinol methylase